MLMTTCINNTNANARPLLCFTFIASLLLLNLILFLTYYSESGITNDISGVSNVLSHHALAAHGIQDLNGISLTSLSKSSNSSSETHSTPRIVYISGHFGTVQDFKNVARLLNISSSVSIFNPRALGYYGQSMDSAKKLNQEHWMGGEVLVIHQCGPHTYVSLSSSLSLIYLDFFCDSFDIAVVGDTNPDARFLLKRIDDSPDEPDPSGHKDWWRIGKDEETQRPCRMKRLIFQTTNRFDYFVGDDNSDKHDGWYNLIRRTAHRRDEKVVWVANNPWEPRHMEINMKGAYVEVRCRSSLSVARFSKVLRCPLSLMQPITIIRPLGISDLAESNNNRNSFTNLVNVKNNDTHLAVFIDNSVNGFPSFAKENNLTHLIKFLPKHYGGPLELKKYKFVVEIPYQMSTMKVRRRLDVVG